MRIDDLKTWLLANLSSYIAARSTVPVPLTAFDDATIITRDWVEPTKEKILFLDPQPDEIEPGTNRVNYVTETIEAYVAVTRGATEAVMGNQAQQYLSALLDCLKTHPDYFGDTAREYYSGLEGKPDAKGAKATLIFRFEE
jgi:hypothetical protein